MGTRIKDLQVQNVVDGDTLDVTINGSNTRVRLACIDTEESLLGDRSKPVTNAGKAASAMAKNYFKDPSGNYSIVDIEFDTNDSEEKCLKMHRDNYNRLLCYVHKGTENFNLKLVKEGWSPYFVKYGRSRIHHMLLTDAEAEAQSHNFAIWDPATNTGGNTRDYSILLPYWSLRALAVEDYRKKGISNKVLSVRLDYEKIKEYANNGETATIFCDLQNGVRMMPNNAAVISLGSPNHKLNLWIPNTETENAIKIIRLVRLRYSGEVNGSGYAYVRGKITKYRDDPQILLDDMEYISDMPKDK